MGLKVTQNSCFLSIYLAFPPVSAYFSFEEILRINSLTDDSPLKSWGEKTTPTNKWVSKISLGFVRLICDSSSSLVSKNLMQYGML